MAGRATVADVLLRLGCALVAWMVIYAHAIWLATLRVVECGPDGDELWRLLLGFVPFTVGFAFLLRAVAPMAEIAAILRWLAVPLGLLLPLAALPVLSAYGEATLGRVTAGTTPFCAAEPAFWHAWWAPVQTLVLAAVGWRVWVAWRLGTIAQGPR